MQSKNKQPLDWIGVTYAQRLRSLWLGLRAANGEGTGLSRRWRQTWCWCDKGHKQLISSEGRTGLQPDKKQKAFSSKACLVGQRRLKFSTTEHNGFSSLWLQVASKGSCLYPRSRAALSLHLGGRSLQWVVVNTETTTGQRAQKRCAQL